MKLRLIPKIWTFLAALAPAVDALRVAFPRLDARLDRLEARLDGRLGGLRGRVAELRAELAELLEAPDLPPRLAPRLYRLDALLEAFFGDN